MPRSRSSRLLGGCRANSLLTSGLHGDVGLAGCRRTGTGGCPAASGRVSKVTRPRSSRMRSACPTELSAQSSAIPGSGSVPKRADETGAHRRRRAGPGWPCPIRARKSWMVMRSSGTFVEGVVDGDHGKRHDAGLILHHGRRGEAEGGDPPDGGRPAGVVGDRPGLVDRWSGTARSAWSAGCRSRTTGCPGRPEPAPRSGRG